jgi:8-oxo-dGTP pyrophosphatase MutT (NUDIX family)
MRCLKIIIKSEIKFNNRDYHCSQAWIDHKKLTNTKKMSKEKNTSHRQSDAQELFYGGKKSDGSKWHWKLHKINHEEIAAFEPDITAACALISSVKNPEMILAINHHQRGWDIPGGRKAPGESSFQTVKRELIEEANFQTYELTPLAILESYKNPSTSYLIIFKAQGDLGDFFPSEEILETKFMPQKELSIKYQGDKTLLSELFYLLNKKPEK